MGVSNKNGAMTTGLELYNLRGWGSSLFYGALFIVAEAR